MRRKEGRKWINLISLYLNYVFQKSTVIIFLVSILFMILALIIIINPNFDMDLYKINPASFHEKYFMQSLFVLSIFNGILVTTISIIYMLQSNSFDALFLSYTKRSMLCISKIIAAGILFLLLAIFEFVLLYGLPLFLYPSFKMDPKALLTIAYIFSSMLFDFALSIVLVVLIPNIFSPMVILFLAIVKNMLTTSFLWVKDIGGEILPILCYKDGYISMQSIYITPIFSLLLFLVYFSIYNIKDIKIA